MSRLQLIIRPGKEGGIITQTEFMFSKFCAEEKLKTKTSEHPGLSVDARALSRLQQLIIRPGEGGGIITQTEFMFSKFCAEEKLKKTTSDHLLSTRLCDRRHSCEQFGSWKRLFQTAADVKSQYDLWTKADGKQEVKVYLRSLKLIIQDILADLGFAYKPPVSLARIPRGERRTQIWTSQRSDLVENYCAPDRIWSCSYRHCCFPRRVVGENESLLRAAVR